jgi:choline dehydrogenase-like flavoprotein
MRSSTRSVDSAEPSTHDAVVVGSGAAGGWAAKELCEGGLDTLVLEAGPALDGDRDFPVPAPAERPLTSRLAAAAGGQRVQLRCGAFNRRTRTFFVNDRENPYEIASGSPFNWFRGRQVGGRLHLWARVMLRLQPEDLAGWPLTYADLAPTYEVVEDFMEVGDATLTRAEERFRSAVAGTARVLPVRLAGAGSQPVPKTLRAAAATGRLTLRPDAVVRRLAVGDVTEVEYVDRRTRERRRARGRVVVLCASAFETVRILLASGVGDSSGRLGRFVADHVMTGIAGPTVGDDPPLPPSDPYDLGSATGFHVPCGHFGIQGGIGRGGGWYMLAHGRMVARPDTRVTLHPRATDAWGVPVANIACAHAAPEHALAAAELRAMRDLAARAGLEVRPLPVAGRVAGLALRLAGRRVLLPSGAFVPGSAAHEVGGAGMGSDPASSVTDALGRLWDAPNVVVADGACFPAGCWQNVTLTIMALAARAARHVVEDFRNGRL